MKLISRAAAKAAGMTRYFTGQPCKRGHIAERFVCDYVCVECSRVKDASPDERERRREYFQKWQRNYRVTHSDRVRATDQKRKPKQAANTRKRRAANPEKHKAALSKSFQKHKAKRMAEAREWRQQNKDASSRHMRAAKAKRRAAEGSFTRQDIERLLTAQRGICAACAADISLNYHVDHMTPLARGGTNWPDNLQLLCGPCNQSKGAKTMAEWMAWKATYCGAAMRTK